MGSYPQETEEGLALAERTRILLNRQAEEQAKQLAEAEEQVAFYGAKLDDATKARDLLFSALNSTEKLRASMNGDPYEDKGEPELAKLRTESLRR